MRNNKCHYKKSAVEVGVYVCKCRVIFVLSLMNSNRVYLSTCAGLEFSFFFCFSPSPLMCLRCVPDACFPVSCSSCLYFFLLCARSSNFQLHFERYVFCARCISRSSAYYLCLHFAAMVSAIPGNTTLIDIFSTSLHWVLLGEFVIRSGLCELFGKRCCCRNKFRRK